MFTTHVSKDVVVSGFSASTCLAGHTPTKVGGETNGREGMAEGAAVESEAKGKYWRERDG